MNIIYDHQIFGWQKYGGISRYFCEIASHLSSNNNIKVDILAPEYITRYLDSYSNLNVHGEFIQEPPVHPRLLRSLNYLKSNISLGALKPQIVHETYFSAFGYINTKKAKKVLTVYDLIHEKFPENFSKLDPTRLEKKLAIRRADHIIAISHQTKQDLIELCNVPDKKVSVIHLGYDIKSKKKQNIFTNTKPYLLYVGNRNGHKNFKNLLVAFGQSKILKNEFRLVCFGGGKFNQEETDYMKKYNISENDLMHVSGGDDILSSCYENAAAFIYPSIYEGFGIPPLEAMNQSCPVICSKASCIPEVVGSAGYYFDPYDIDSIKKSIEKVVYDVKLTDDLIEKGKNRIKKFSWKKCSDETLDVYKGIL